MRIGQGSENRKGEGWRYKEDGGGENEGSAKERRVRNGRGRVALPLGGR